MMCCTVVFGCQIHPEVQVVPSLFPPGNQNVTSVDLWESTTFSPFFPEIKMTSLARWFSHWHFFSDFSTLWVQAEITFLNQLLKEEPESVVCHFILLFSYRLLTWSVVPKNIWSFPIPRTSLLSDFLRDEVDTHTPLGDMSLRHCDMWVAKQPLCAHCPSVVTSSALSTHQRPAVWSWQSDITPMVVMQWDLSFPLFCQLQVSSPARVCTGVSSQLLGSQKGVSASASQAALPKWSCTVPYLTYLSGNSLHRVKTTATISLS